MGVNALVSQTTPVYIVTSVREDTTTSQNALVSTHSLLFVSWCRGLISWKKVGPRHWA